VQFFAPDYGRHDGPEGHGWIHRQLGLNEEEAARIDAFEEPYRSERARVQTEFDFRVKTLARLLETNSEFSPEVTSAVADLHRVHGQLQQLAIKHYFDMLSVLPPGKQSELRELAVKSLSSPQ
tara:strand:+ start:780 stop:1148 length:369 start_codon:yes stop_codon:yes gene_type:complete